MEGDSSSASSSHSSVASTSSHSGSSTSSSDSTVEELLQELLDDDDAKVAMVLDSSSDEAEEEPRQHDGSLPGKAPNKKRDFVAAHAKLMHQYFNGLEMAQSTLHASVKTYWKQQSNNQSIEQSWPSATL